MYVEDFKIGTQVFEDVIGKTYRGENRKTGKIALVKILHPILAERKELVRAFHEGAATSRRLKSQHFCQTLSHGTEHDRSYVVLEHFDHIQLSTILQRQHVLSIFDAPGVVEKLAVALRTLHLSGEVHGALTPDCVFFTKTLDSAKICNFGYEKLIRLLILDKHPGLDTSIRYFSPELTTGQRHLHRQSDVYSLGVLFYRLLVGNTPWQSVKFTDFFSGKRRLSIIPPSLRRLEIPDALDSVIMQAVEENVDDRCANLSLFIQQIAGERANILATLTPTTAFVFNDVEPEPTTKLANGAGQVKRDNQDDTADNHVGADLVSSKLDQDVFLPESPVEPEPDSDSDLAEPPQIPEASQYPDFAQQPLPPDTQTGPIFPEQSEQPPLPLDPIFEQKATAEPLHDSISPDQPLSSDLPGESIHQGAPEGLPEPIYPERGDPADPFDEPVFGEQEDAGTQDPADAAGVSGLSMPDADPAEETEQRITEELPEPVSNQMDEPAFDFGETSKVPSSVESTFATDATFDIDIPPPVAERLVKPEQTAAESDTLPDHVAPAAEADSTLQTPMPVDTDELFLKSGPAGAEFPMLQSDEFDDRALGLMRRDARPTNGHATNGATSRKNGHGTAPGAAAVVSGVQHNGAGLAGGRNGDAIHDDVMDYDEDFATTHTVDIERTSLTGWSPMTFARILLITVLPLTIVLLVLTFSLDLDFSEGLDGLRDGFFPSQNEKAQVLRRQQVQRRPAAARKTTGGSANRATSLSQAARPSGAPRPRSTARQQSSAGTRRQSQNSAQAVNPSRSSSNGGELAPRQGSAPATRAVELALLVQNGGRPLQANVYVDGAVVGRTNQRGTIVISGLAPGRAYLVKVEAAGFQVWAKEFVAAGPGISNLVADLTSLTTGPRVQSQPAVTAPARRNGLSNAGSAGNIQRTARDSRRRPVQQIGPGTISVNLSNVESLSDAYIYVNGSLWNGRSFTAPAQLELPPGTYVIEVRKDGYVSAPPSHTVNIINGEAKTVSFILTAN